MVEAVEGVVTDEMGTAVDADAVVLLAVDIEGVSDGKGNKVGIVHFFDSAVNVC